MRTVEANFEKVQCVRVGDDTFALDAADQAGHPVLGVVTDSGRRKRSGIPAKVFARQSMREGFSRTGQPSFVVDTRCPVIPGLHAWLAT